MRAEPEEDFKDISDRENYNYPLGWKTETMEGSDEIDFHMHQVGGQNHVRVGRLWRVSEIRTARNGEWGEIKLGKYKNVAPEDKVSGIGRVIICPIVFSILKLQ